MLLFRFIMAGLRALVALRNRQLVQIALVGEFGNACGLHVQLRPGDQHLPGDAGVWRVARQQIADGERGDLVAEFRIAKAIRNSRTTTFVTA